LLPTPPHEQESKSNIFTSVNTTQVSGNTTTPHGPLLLFSSTQPTPHTTTSLQSFTKHAINQLEKTQEKWLTGKKKKEKKESKMNAGIAPTKTMYNFHFRKKRKRGGKSNKREIANLLSF